MKLNKDKGKWVGENDFHKSTIIDDVAYHLYCVDRNNNACSTQRIFMWNVQQFEHPKMVKYYKKSEKILKLEKLINRCHES